MPASAAAEPDHAYRGRFAPSPTGPLHAGSLVAALASWLDARAHNGRWLVRIEDVDAPRCVAGADQLILAQLAACGLLADEPVRWQSTQGSAYQEALDRLAAAGLAYPCGCTRREIEAVWATRGRPRQRNSELVYPGTCRAGLQGRKAGPWRFRTDVFPSNTALSSVKSSVIAINREYDVDPSAAITVDHSTTVWTDRRLGRLSQDVQAEVGDFVLRRADGLWTYQLAVVVDDAAQGITHVVRGEDLADNTPRQIRLQQALAARTPLYLHTPLVRGANGEKLSKQNGATPLDLSAPLAALQGAGAVLGVVPTATTAGDWLGQAVAIWRERRWTT